MSLFPWNSGVTKCTVFSFATLKTTITQPPALRLQCSFTMSPTQQRYPDPNHATEFKRENYTEPHCFTVFTGISASLSWLIHTSKYPASSPSPHTPHVSRPPEADHSSELWWKQEILKALDWILIQNNKQTQKRSRVMSQPRENAMEQCSVE